MLDNVANRAEIWCYIVETAVKITKTGLQVRYDSSMHFAD